MSIGVGLRRGAETEQSDKKTKNYFTINCWYSCSLKRFRPEFPVHLSGCALIIRLSIIFPRKTVQLNVTPPVLPGTISGPCHRILIWEEDEKPRPLVVFFGAKDLEEGQFNFPSLNHSLRAHRLLLNNGGNQWYQGGIPGFGADFETCAAQLLRWQEALGASEICLIGTSMGAYGALRYGARLGLRVLAFSCDHRLGATLSKSRRYYDGPEPAPCPDLRPSIRVAPQGFSATLLVGERDVGDLYAALQLQSTGRVQAVSILGADHFIPMFLSKRGKLSRMLTNFVEQGCTSLPCARGRALEISNYVATVYAATLAEDRRDWDEAEARAREALAYYSDGEAARLLLGRLLVSSKRYQEAISILSQALVVAPEDRGLSMLAQALREEGQLGQALMIHETILAREPGMHSSHYAIALILQKMGRLSDARDALMHALRIKPNHATYLERMHKIETLLSHPKASLQK